MFSGCSQLLTDILQTFSDVFKCSKMFKDVFRCSQLLTNVIGSCQIGAANCILFFSIWQTVQSADKLVVKEQILMNSEADTNLDLLFLRWMLLAQIPPSISKIWFSAFLKPFAHSSVFHSSEHAVLEKLL